LRTSAACYENVSLSGTSPKPDRTVRNGSQFLRQEHDKLVKEAASTKISANKSNTKCEEQRQQIIDLAGLVEKKRHSLAELMKQVKTVESDIETTSTNRTNKQLTIEGLTKEASANTKEWEHMKSTT
jgi:chromosome segregation ATPase